MGGDRQRLTGGWSQEERTLPQDSQRPRGPATLSLTLDLSIPEPQLELSGRHVLLGSTRAPRAPWLSQGATWSGSWEGGLPRQLWPPNQALRAWVAVVQSLGTRVGVGRGLVTVGKPVGACPTLCDPIDSGLPGFSIHGILQARTLEWVAISFSNA